MKMIWRIRAWRTAGPFLKGVESGVEKWEMLKNENGVHVQHAIVLFDPEGGRYGEQHSAERCKVRLPVPTTGQYRIAFNGKSTRVEHHKQVSRRNLSK